MADPGHAVSLLAPLMTVVAKSPRLDVSMPRLALKPDSSFFRKIALGAVGSRRVAEDLDRRGHRIAELERGAMDTKLWKEVKRKRVRIPDLVCERCGLRVESRAKTKATLSMSHSPTAQERAWDFGMVDADVVAFPVCKARDESQWSAGRLSEPISYWHERNWIRWQPEGKVNYVRVSRFRAVPQGSVATKGVTEGSETSVAWQARFSSRDGVVETVEGQRITIVRAGDGHRHTQTVPTALRIVVAQGDDVALNQIVASEVRPETDHDLRCTGALPERHLPRLLASRERTQRFTGVKLARLRGVEAVIALGEAGTGECVGMGMLSAILDDANRPYFARSAAAWCLSRIGGTEACRRLVRAFGDVDRNLRAEALEGVVSVNSGAVPVLLDGLRQVDPAIAVGCAEALRQHGTLSADSIREISAQLADPNPSVWVVWLAGHLPRERLAGAVAHLQRTAPELHYAITLLWSFVESWVARRWELRPGAGLPDSDAHED